MGGARFGFRFGRRDRRLSAGLFSIAVSAAARRAGAAIRDRGISLEHRRRLCGSGLGRLRSCSLAAAPMLPWALTRISGGRRCWEFRSAPSLALGIAAVIGALTLRLSGHYFSMATIAIAELVRLIVTNTLHISAPPSGLSKPISHGAAERVRSLLHLRTAVAITILFLVILAVTLLITWWMTNSWMGFYLRAIRDSGTRAAHPLGARASRTKLSAFMLSGDDKRRWRALRR